MTGGKQLQHSLAKSWNDYGIERLRELITFSGPNLLPSWRPGGDLMYGLQSNAIVNAA